MTNSHFALDTILGGIAESTRLARQDADACGDVDHATGRVCTRGATHPGEHLSEPNGKGW